MLSLQASFETMEVAHGEHATAGRLGRAFAEDRFEIEYRASHHTAAGRSIAAFLQDAHDAARQVRSFGELDDSPVVETILKNLRVSTLVREFMNAGWLTAGIANAASPDDVGDRDSLWQRPIRLSSRSIVSLLVHLDLQRCSAVLFRTCQAVVTNSQPVVWTSDMFELTMRLVNVSCFCGDAFEHARSLMWQACRRTLVLILEQGNLASKIACDCPSEFCDLAVQAIWRLRVHEMSVFVHGDGDRGVLTMTALHDLRPRWPVRILLHSLTTRPHNNVVDADDFVSALRSILQHTTTDSLYYEDDHNDISELLCELVQHYGVAMVLRILENAADPTRYAVLSSVYAGIADPSIQREFLAIWPSELCPAVGLMETTLATRRHCFASTDECPITCEPFRDPVMASDGHVYERDAILKHMLTSRASPMTRQPIDADLAPVDCYL